jgi:hypothetical protein
MEPKPFHLAARISSDSPSAVRPPLVQFVGPNFVIRRSEDGFTVETGLEGEMARVLNRQLLSESRQAEKRPRRWAERTSSGTTARFLDYVPKGVRAAARGPATGRT